RGRRLVLPEAAPAIRSEVPGREWPGVPQRLARPPCAVLPPRRSVREAVAVEGEPELLGWSGRERIAAEEGCGDRRRREAARQQILEVAAAGRPSEQEEPELEVHPWLVWGDEGWRPVEIAGLVAKLVRQPLDAVSGALEHHFPPDERHLREEMIGVHGAVGVEQLAEGRERPVERAQRRYQGKELDHGEWDQDRDCPGEERSPQRTAGTGAWCPEPPPDGCGEPPELPIVEQEEGESDRQVVEEAVVPGEDDRDLHAQHGDEDDRAHRGGPPDEEWEPELHDVGVQTRELVRPERHLVRVPAHPGGKRRGLVVARHRREIAPAGIAEQQLRRTRLDVQAEEQPEHQEEGQRVGRGRGPGTEPAPGPQEREEGGLEEQVAPLEGEEVLPDRDEGEIHDPAGRQRDAGGDVEGEPAAEDRAARGGDAERAVAVIDPEERRRCEEAPHAGEIVARRQEALATEEERHLGEQREEGDEEDQSEQSEEEIAGMRPPGRLARLVQAAGLLGTRGASDPEAVPRDQAVEVVPELAQARYLVEPPERRQDRTQPERARRGGRPAPGASVGGDQVHGLLAGLPREIGVTLQHDGVAERLQADPSPEPALESLRFADAEAAVTVVEQD